MSRSPRRRIYPMECGRLGPNNNTLACGILQLFGYWHRNRFTYIHTHHMYIYIYVTGFCMYWQTIDFSFAIKSFPNFWLEQENHFMWMSCRCRLLLLLFFVVIVVVFIAFSWHDKRMRHQPSSLWPKSKCYLNYDHDLAKKPDPVWRSHR